MPIHDWSKVPAGLFHDFHQTWTCMISDALNSGLMPYSKAALLERKQPTDGIEHLSDELVYARLANRIAIKHNLIRTVAIVEIVSPVIKSRPMRRDSSWTRWWISFAMACMCC